MYLLSLSGWGFLLVPAFALESSLDKRWADVRVRHAWNSVPDGWIVHSKDVPPGHVLNMQIGLKQDRFDELIDELYQVSDPDNARYGQYLSEEAVHELVTPHQDTANAVEEWLMHHGIELSSIRRSPAGDCLYLSVPISQAEHMLSAKYRVFYNPSSSKYVVRTTAYSLPSVLHSHISVVAPTTYFGQMEPVTIVDVPLARGPVFDDFHSPASGLSLRDVEPRDSVCGNVSTSCILRMTPTCLRALYNTTWYTPRATDKNKIGIAGYGNEFANDADLQIFLERFRPEAVNATVEHVQVNGGGNNQSIPGLEANLNVQYAMAMTFPTPNIYYSTGGSPPFVPDSEIPDNTNEPFLDWANYILSLDDAHMPQTFTTSYSEPEQTVPEDYAQAVCSVFAQLSARGASILFSSGDSGVGGLDCRANDGTNAIRFKPHFPSSCPFVTTVGATFGINPEEGAFFSGGGFSNYFAQPSYQSAAVSSFLDGLGSQYAGLFNASGRAYPDVSAQALFYQVVVGGITTPSFGTSAATPVFAGIVSLLNDFRIASGKPPLGFLNPFLYSKGAAGLNDITSGNNLGCSTPGFSATHGWDPVSGCEYRVINPVECHPRSASCDLKLSDRFVPFVTRYQLLVHRESR